MKSNAKLFEGGQMMTGPYLSSLQAAEFIRSTVGTMANWRLHGEGPNYIKLRRKVLYDEQDLKRWLEKQKVRTADDGDSF